MVNDSSPSKITERISIILSTILLAYLLAQFVDVPTSQYNFSLLGVGIPVRIDFNTLVGIAVAAITASGTAWLLQSHPNAENNQLLPHLILPSLSALILNILLSNLSLNSIWWAYFISGALFLLFVILLEYVVSDPDDYRQPYAATGLNALSIAGFLVLSVSLSSTNLRLIYLLPPVFFAASLVNLRASNLRLKNRWLLPQAIACGIIITQLSAALHYLPLTPLQFGLLLLGPLYAITNLIINFDQKLSGRQALIEPISVMTLIMLLAIWIR